MKTLSQLGADTLPRTGRHSATSEMGAESSPSPTAADTNCKTRRNGSLVPVRGDASRQTKARLCRYIIRPALTDERAQFNAAGQVKIKAPWRDRT